ncbi:MAG: bacterial transcriptional activator domain-containing protein [Trueperaceae bacterium]|nr:bacterial transcriptional activator domain-containing protein [Trueperaceae bacterium]
MSDLLWPLAASPRNNLRQAVHAVRQRAPIVDGDPLRLSPEVRIAEGEGDLLSAYDLSDCAELHAWTEFQVERRRVARIERWSARADALEAEGRMADALAAARRALEVDRLSELAHRRVIRLAYLAGDRAAALDAYHRCARMLQAEFGVRPLPETSALARDVAAATVQRTPGRRSAFR